MKYRLKKEQFKIAAKASENYTNWSDIAYKIGVYRGDVSKVINGKIMSYSVLVKMCKYLKLNLNNYLEEI